MTLYGIDKIRELLPHRYPFLLIDKIIEIVPNEKVVAIKNVTINEPFFNGHFPSKPVMPGVLIIEAMAQASGVMAYEVLKQNYPDEPFLHFLASVDEARFKRVVSPGDQLRLEVTALRIKRDVCKFRGEATVDGALACSATFMSVRSRD